jgi:hypothetical protein
MRGRNVTKPFSIAGFVLAEIYMLFTVLAPLKSGLPVPGDYLVWRVLCAAIFFGPLGALVGLGIGLLVGAVLPKR